MTFLSGKVRLILLGVLILSAAVTVAVDFTGLCRLRAVTLDGEQVSDFASIYGLRADAPIIHQPLDSLAEALLTRPGIAKIDIDYSLPAGLTIATNEFMPVCFISDPDNSRLLGLTEDGRIITIPADQSDWEHPILTGVRIGPPLSFCTDLPVQLVLEQLGRVRSSHTDLYRLITEIDLQHDRYVLVTISGLPYALRLTPENLAGQLEEFVYFLEKFAPDLSECELVDLRFDDMIIQVGKES